MKLTDAIYHDEKAARRHLEKLRWPDGTVCPHCGSVGLSKRLKGKSTRAGVWKCRECRKPFTVTVGTVFERSHIPLTKWLMASHLMAASKKGVSALQLQRTLGVTYKSAWFMAHRLREAVKPKEELAPLGGEEKVVECDEFYIGKEREKKNPWSRGWGHKCKVLGIVERGGEVRTLHVTSTKAEHLRPILQKHISLNSVLMTDEATQYIPLGRMFSSHCYTNHSAREYVRDGHIHSNTIEGFFSILRRGLAGVYQHCAPRHLQRYLWEFSFRYNQREALGVDDAQRITKLLKGIEGKRIMRKELALNGIWRPLRDSSKN